jgi:hypothetical protein
MPPCAQGHKQMDFSDDLDWQLMRWALRQPPGPMHVPLRDGDLGVARRFLNAEDASAGPCALI